MEALLEEQIRTREAFENVSKNIAEQRRTHGHPGRHSKRRLFSNRNLGRGTREERHPARSGMGRQFAGASAAGAAAWRAHLPTATMDAPESFEDDYTSGYGGSGDGGSGDGSGGHAEHDGPDFG